MSLFRLGTELYVTRMYCSIRKPLMRVCLANNIYIFANWKESSFCLAVQIWFDVFKGKEFQKGCFISRVN